MRIPEDTIEDVRRATDIVDLVNGYVSLRKTGRNFVGLCPFHEDRRPSLNVSQEKQIYKCFACGAGGNVFSFLMALENIPFLEAVELLAGKAGIALPKMQQSGEVRRDELYRLNDKIARWYHDLLTRQPAGLPALAYCTERGFTSETIERFEIGYAPDAWDSLLRFVKEDGPTVKLLLQLGLAVPRDKGTGQYDRFRNRLMFPIRNELGRVCGFGGRTLGNDPAKYMNSPESPVYQKGRLLYGMYQARDAIRERKMALVVEGYVDLITLVQAGIGNVVAPLGTALTDQQARVLHRFTDEVVLVFDADAAGAAATRRGADVLLQEGLDVTVITLEAGHDPDSYIRQYGGPAFEVLIEQRRGLLAYYGELYAGLGREKKTQQQAALLKQLVEMIGRIGDGIRRDVLANAVADAFAVSVHSVRQELQQHKPAERRPQPAAPPRKLQQDSQAATAERDLLEFLVQHPDQAALVLAHFDRAPAEDPRVLAVLHAVRHKIEGGQTPAIANLLDMLETEDLRNYLLNMDRSSVQLSREFLLRKGAQDDGKRLEQMIRGRALYLLEREKQAVQQRITDLEGKGGDIAAELQRFKALAQEIGRLQKVKTGSS